jgi:hypothetical protein
VPGTHPDPYTFSRSHEGTLARVYDDAAGVGPVRECADETWMQGHVHEPATWLHDPGDLPEHIDIVRQVGVRKDARHGWQ